MRNTPFLLLMPSGGGITLPFSDTFNRVDAALSLPWIVPNAAIVSNQVVITPTRGTELLKAANVSYASGTGDWTIFGTNTVTNDSGQLKVTAVSNTNPAARLTLNSTSLVPASLTVGKVYQIEIDLRVDATSSVDVGVSIPGVWRYFTTTSQTLVTVKQIVIPAAGALLIDLIFSTAVGSICWVNRVSIKEITVASALATILMPSANVGVSIVPITEVVADGVIVNLDSPTNPQNYVMLLHYGTSYRLIKCVNGTVSPAVATGGVGAAVSGAKVELRKTNSTTYQVWYNNIQRGTDVTISDASIIGNLYHGFVSFSEDNSLDSFLAS